MRQNTFATNKYRLLSYNNKILEKIKIKKLSIFEKVTIVFTGKPLLKGP